MHVNELEGLKRDHIWIAHCWMWSFKPGECPSAADTSWSGLKWDSSVRVSPMVCGLHGDGFSRTVLFLEKHTPLCLASAADLAIFWSDTCEMAFDFEFDFGFWLSPHEWKKSFRCLPAQLPHSRFKRPRASSRSFGCGLWGQLRHSTPDAVAAQY